MKRKCDYCGEMRAAAEFGKERRCRECRNARCREWRKKNPDKQLKACRAWFARHPDYKRARYASNPAAFRAAARMQAKAHPEKIAARNAVNNAVIAGRLKRPTECSNCGGVRRITAHHHDYAKPFEIVWLCYSCHGVLHAMGGAK